MTLFYLYLLRVWSVIEWLVLLLGNAFIINYDLLFLLLLSSCAFYFFLLFLLSAVSSIDFHPVLLPSLSPFLPHPLTMSNSTLWSRFPPRTRFSRVGICECSDARDRTRPCCDGGSDVTQKNSTISGENCYFIDCVLIVSLLRMYAVPIFHFLLTWIFWNVFVFIWSF